LYIQNLFNRRNCNFPMSAQFFTISVPGNARLPFPLPLRLLP
jgi:hypothetical protein